MHIVCGSVYGRVLRPVWGSRPLRAACLFGLLCVAIIYHAIYNLLVSVGGTAQLLAYAIPCSRRCASTCSGSRPQRKSNKIIGPSAFEMDADHFFVKNLPACSLDKLARFSKTKASKTTLKENRHR